VHDLIGRRLPIPLLVGAVLIGVLAILPVGKAMAFFDSMKVNLFSDMKGVVTLNGEPVAGAVVKRLAKPEKSYWDETITDAQGNFSFDVMKMHTLWKLLPGQVTILQKVTIEYQGQEYLAWKMGGANGRYKGELNEIDVLGSGGEIDIDLICELTAKETAKSAAGIQIVRGICTWKDAEIIKEED